MIPIPSDALANEKLYKVDVGRKVLIAATVDDGAVCPIDPPWDLCKHYAPTPTSTSAAESTTSLTHLIACSFHLPGALPLCV